MKQSDIKPQIKNFYGAANTYGGFYSLFESIFSPERLGKVYIIKGGPGCGKSTAIGKVSEYALKKGLQVENYFCSSSPTSLDGVVIPQLSTAVIDGTSPHAAEPKYPAVCELLVDFGTAWNTEKAKKLDKDIRKLNYNKSCAYKRAYAYLSSCQSAREVKMDCLSSYLLENKMLSAVKRICSNLNFRKTDGNMIKVFTDCISGKGNIHLDTFERLSATRYFIKDYADIAHIFFGHLADTLTSCGADIIVAADPLFPEHFRGIWLPEDGISFTLYDDDFALSLDKKQLPYKIINMTRFCDLSNFRQSKIFYKYADKSEQTLMNGAVRQLALASEYHDEIERLYHSFTDYDSITKMTEKIISEIF